MADVNFYLQHPISTIAPVNNTFAPAPDYMVAGSPPPQPAAVKLATWNRDKIVNPIMKLFSKSADSISQT